MLPKIIIFIGSIFLLLGVCWPATTVMSYVFFRPLIQPFAWLQYKLFGLPIAFPFSFIVILIGILCHFFRKPWSLTLRQNGFFTLFMFICFISVSALDYFAEGIAALIKLITVWFLYNIAYNSVKKEEDAIRIIDTLIASAIIPLLFGFYQAITGNYDLIYDAEVNRISSVFATGNDYGIFLTFVTAAAAVRLKISATTRMRLQILIILVMVLVSQVLSLNRGTWLALTLGFIVAAIKYYKQLNLKLLIPVSLIFILLFSGIITQRFQELKEPENVHYHNINTLEGRIGYWYSLLPIISERPIFGFGLGSSAQVTQKYFGKQNKFHNDYLLITLELGLIGSIVYVFFLGKILVYFVFRRVRSSIWIWNFAMLMLSVYFVIISFAQNIVQSILNFPIFMILFAVVFKLNSFPQSKRK